MATINDLINAGFQHWNEPARLVEIAEELESRSRLSQSRLFLDRALALDANVSPYAYYTLAFTYFRDAGNRAEDGENALMDGIEATDSDIVKAWYAAMLEDESLAETLLNDVRINDDISVRLALGGALHWRGRIEESLDVFRGATAQVEPGKTPDGLKTYCSSLIWMYAQGFDIDLDTEVKPRIMDLLREYPERYSVISLTVQYYQVLQDWEQTAAMARRLLEIIPDEETTMLALAIALRNLNEEDRAIMWLNRAIGAKPSFARARAVLAGIYEKQGKFDLAEEIAREIPIMNPGYIMGKAFAADILRRIGKTDEAVAMFHEGYAAMKPYEKGEIAQRLAEMTKLAGVA